MFGGLRHSFFELAKILMKTDIGIINAKEDMSNVRIEFINEEPAWTVLPDILTRKYEFMNK